MITLTSPRKIYSVGLRKKWVWLVTVAVMVRVAYLFTGDVNIPCEMPINLDPPISWHCVADSAWFQSHLCRCWPWRNPFDYNQACNREESQCDLFHFPHLHGVFCRHTVVDHNGHIKNLTLWFSASDSRYVWIWFTTVCWIYMSHLGFLHSIFRTESIDLFINSWFQLIIGNRLTFIE